MSQQVSTLLQHDRGQSVRRTALVAALVLVAVWIVDAVVDAVLVPGVTFADEFARPRRDELWVRALIATLIVVLWLQQRSRARLRLFSAALSAAPDGIQVVGLDGRIAYSNAAVRNIYGFAPEELQGKDVSELNVDAAVAERYIIPALRAEGHWQGEIDVKHKDGRSFPIWLTSSMVRDARGAPLAMIGVIRDISERKRAEDALRGYARQLEEATRLKELFADILRHDLLGPASALRLSIDRLLRQPCDASAAKLLEAADRSCTKLTDMIEGAARYAKLSGPQEIQFTRLDLAAVLRSAVSDLEMARTEHDATFAVDVPDGECPVVAHAMIAEVFENLLSNALKYGPRGGTIGIALQDIGEHWRASVSDSGPGVPDADKAKVFTRYERLRKEGVKGTGVGLAIAKRIVELHGGRIWVEDNPSGGSIFSVVLAKAR